MILAVDIGNTNTEIGVWNDDEVVFRSRVSSAHKTSDEIELYLRSLFAARRCLIDHVRGAILASVVPSLDTAWKRALGDISRRPPFVVSSGIPTGLDIGIENPSEIGADRLVNAVAAVHLHGAPIVAVDLGTAVTVDVVSRTGAYIGGAIAPGLAMSAEALCSRTAKLPQISLTAPERAIGSSTVEAIRSGIVYGMAGLVDALVERVFDELGERTPVIAAGGDASAVAPWSRTITHVENDLTLLGMKLIYDRCAADMR